MFYYNEKCSLEPRVNPSEIELVAMAGSKGGKQSKGKGKSKSKKPEQFKSKIGLAEISNENPNGPIHSEGEKINSPTSTSRVQYTDKELEQFLYLKLDGLYTKAKIWLLNSGYSLAEVDRAILNAGYITGTLDLQNNIVTNAISFIEKKFELNRRAFKNIDVLYRYMLNALITSTMQDHPNMQRSNGMWHLLSRSWGSLPSTTMSAHGYYGSSSHSENEDAGARASSSYESNVDSSLTRTGILVRVSREPALVSHLRENAPIFAASLQRKIGVPVFEQHATSSAGDEPTEVSDLESSDFLTSIDDNKKTELLVDLVKTIDSLYKEVDEQKEWAQKKVIASAQRLNNDLMELRVLRVEKIDNEELESEKINESIQNKIVSRWKVLRKDTDDANRLTEDVRRLEMINEQMRPDVEAYKLDASESDRDLQVVMKRQRKCTKKLAEMENQRSIFQSQCEAEEERVMQLETELCQAEKETEETEIKWRQAIEEKEQMYALLAEEIKLAETQKANSRADLLKLRQKVEIDSQLAMDDCQRLEDELSSLRISRRISADIFLCNSLEGTSSGSSAPNESYEKISHVNCMYCMDNEVAVVLLPCTHQVVCFSCYEGRCKTQGWCPYCGARIEHSIKVYGPNS